MGVWLTAPAGSFHVLPFFITATTAVGLFGTFIVATRSNKSIRKRFTVTVITMMIIGMIVAFNGHQLEQWRAAILMSAMFVGGALAALATTGRKSEMYTHGD